MFDTQLRPQDDAGQAWPDIVGDFTTENDDYNNF
jgi:hypothetical protein